MKLLSGVVLTSVVATNMPTGALAAPQTRAARICISRPGENGSLNVLPVTIRVGTQAGIYFNAEAFGEFTIAGEEKFCVTPLDIDTPQKIAITLRFPHPWWNPRNPEYFTTRPVWLFVIPGKTTQLVLCPRNVDNNDSNWDKTGWHRLWVLSPPESRHACLPDYWHWKP